MTPLYAHSTDRSDWSDWEPLLLQLERVGARAAGLLHDLGKASKDFQSRLLGERPKGVDHSSAGARLAGSIEAWGLIGKLIAFCFAGHHAGLADGVEGTGSGDEERTDGPECRRRATEN